MKTKMTPEQLAVKERLRKRTKAELDAVWNDPAFRAEHAAWKKQRRAAAEMCAMPTETFAGGLRRMRERADLTQAEIARRMDVKATAVSRLERFGASTLQALFGYAKACGYKIRITAESKQDQFAFA